jgi:hypothetical protein
VAGPPEKVIIVAPVNFYYGGDRWSKSKWSYRLPIDAKISPGD